MAKLFLQGEGQLSNLMTVREVRVPEKAIVKPFDMYLGLH